MFTGTISGNCDASYINSAGELVQASSPGSISVLEAIPYSSCQQASRLLGGSISIVIMGYTKAYIYYITSAIYACP